MTAVTTESYRERMLRDAANIALPDLDTVLSGEPVYRSVSPKDC
ncbi:hypothetical protein ACFW4O_13760 [Streptomyces mutabilis]